jgi:hypothetical protein
MERGHQTLKNRILIGDLSQQIDAFVELYNLPARP